MLSDASKSYEVLVANRVLAFLVQKTQGPASHYKRNFQVHVVERCTAVLKRGFEPEPSNITRRLTISLTPMLVNLESSRTTGLPPRNPSVVKLWFTDSSLILLCSQTSYVLVAVFAPPSANLVCPCNTCQVCLHLHSHGTFGKVTSIFFSD